MEGRQKKKKKKKKREHKYCKLLQYVGRDWSNGGLLCERKGVGAVAVSLIIFAELEEEVSAGGSFVRSFVRSACLLVPCPRCLLRKKEQATYYVLGS